MNTQNINNNNSESNNGVNNSREEIKVGTEVWTTIELHEEYGKRGHVVRKYFADHGVWCLDIEFEDGTRKDYAEEYVTTEKPWAVVGAKCRHKYLNRDVVLTITAVGQYYGIKAESEDGKVKRCGLVRDFEPVEDIREAEDIKVGDRVWCKHGEVMGTVTAIRIWNPDYAFKVRLDKPVTLFGQTFEETEFRRAGITKNYDRDGMIVGNAQYYTEQLKYGPASIIEYELAGVALRTESTREDVEPDSREGWGNEYRVTIHHQTGDTTETMTLSETAELLARMYQEEQGKAATLEPASEITEADFSDTLADDLKAGDRVLSRHYGAQATVLGREWDKQRKAWYYRVQFDKMQRNMDGSEFNVTEFHRDGLTKNYDPVTCSERVGNAEYYRESLLAEFWGNDRTPRTVYGMEIFKPTDRRPSWLVVADIFGEPKEMTLREVCDMLAVRYQEEQDKAA